MKAKANLHTTDPVRLADELGKLRATIKQLTEQQKAIEATLKAQHIEIVSGSLFKVKIAYGIETKRINWRNVAAKFNPSRQLIAAHTTTTTSDRVTVTAHEKH